MSHKSYSKKMFSFFKKKEEKKDVQQVAKKQLKANEAVFQSLRDYDEGKKEISTTDVKRHLQAVQSAS